MSSSVTVVGGVNNSTISGVVTVPVTGLSTSAISALQASLVAITASVQGGILGLTNNNLVSNSIFTAAPTVSTNPYVLEITNTNGTCVSPGTVSGSVTVQSADNNVIVQAPGTVTLTGSGVTNTNYVFGSASNVVLSTMGGTNTIVAAGGNDTLNMQGSNAATLSGGSDLLRTYTGFNTVFATGSSSILAGTPSGNAGKLDFMSSSSGSANINGGSGSLTVSSSTGDTTAVGGSGGMNSLIGGSGAVYFVGGGNGDTLAAGFNGATTVTASNYLYAGTGNETLLASSVTGTNLLQAGSGSDAMTASGSGTQYFFGSDGSATMTGSTMSGANNIYFFGGNSTSSGGNDIITNFGRNSELIATNGQNISTITSSTTNGVPGALVTLTDGTHITLLGVNAASISGSIGQTAIV